MSETQKFVFTPVETPRISRVVVVLRDKRRPQVLDKDLVGESIEDLSARYTKGSLYQDLQTRERSSVQARATVVGAWKLYPRPEVVTP